MGEGVAIVLAAGAGTRLGGVAKALLVDDGVTLLERVVSAARAGGVTRIGVVVGAPHGAAVAEAARRLGANVVWNTAPERGMASSIGDGFAAALAEGDGAWGLLWPVDHAWIAPATLRALVAALPGRAAVIPTHGDRGGHPVVVARSAWPALARAGQASGGARQVLAALDPRRLPVDDPGVCRDLDRPSDLAALGRVG